MRGSEDLEVAVDLSELVRVRTGEDGVTEEEGEDLRESALGEGEGGARVAWVRLNEEEAVLRAKPGRGDDEAALCEGVTGALTLPPPPP